MRGNPEECAMIMPEVTGTPATGTTSQVLVKSEAGTLPRVAGLNFRSNLSIHFLDLLPDLLTHMNRFPESLRDPGHQDRLCDIDPDLE